MARREHVMKDDDDDGPYRSRGHYARDSESRGHFYDEAGHLKDASVADGTRGGHHYNNNDDSDGYDHDRQPPRRKHHRRKKYRGHQTDQDMYLRDNDGHEESCPGQKK